MTEITLSPEAWAAISAIALPLTAALASNLRLVTTIRVLTKELTSLKHEMSKIATHEGRLLKLETFVARRITRQRK